MTAQSSPLSVRVAGLLCIASGIESICSFAIDAFNGRMNIPVGALMLFFGKGILAGSTTSRFWVLVFSGVITFVGITTGIWTTFRTESLAEYSDLTIAYTAFQCTLYFGTTAFVFFTLMKPDVRNWFESQRPETSTDGNWALPAGIAFAVIIVMTTAKSWYTTRQIQNSFPIATTVVLQGESPVSGFRIESDAICRNSFGCPSIPSVSYTTEFSHGGTIRVRLTGITDMPVDITFYLEGHLPEKVRLTRSSPELLTRHWTRRT